MTMPINPYEGGANPNPALASMYQGGYQQAINKQAATTYQDPQSAYAYRIGYLEGQAEVGRQTAAAGVVTEQARVSKIQDVESHLPEIRLAESEYQQGLAQNNPALAQSAQAKLQAFGIDPNTYPDAMRFNDQAWRYTKYFREQQIGAQAAEIEFNLGYNDFFRRYPTAGVTSSGMVETGYNRMNDVPGAPPPGWTQAGIGQGSVWTEDRTGRTYGAPPGSTALNQLGIGGGGIDPQNLTSRNLTADASAAAGIPGYGPGAKNSTFSNEVLNEAIKKYYPGSSPSNFQPYGTDKWYQDEIFARNLKAKYTTEDNPTGSLLGLTGAARNSAFVPFGDQRQQEIGDISSIRKNADGSIEIRQNIYDEFGRVRKIGGEEGILISGGGKGAVESGMFSFGRAQTPIVTSQWNPNEILASSAFPGMTGKLSASDVQARPDLFSRLGDGAYGGVVQPLDWAKGITPPSTNPNSPFYYGTVPVGTYPSNKWNLATPGTPGIGLGAAALVGSQAVAPKENMMGLPVPFKSVSTVSTTTTTPSKGEVLGYEIPFISPVIAYFEPQIKETKTVGMPYKTETTFKEKYAESPTDFTGKFVTAEGKPTTAIGQTPIGVPYAIAGKEGLWQDYLPATDMNKIPIIVTPTTTTRESTPSQFDIAYERTVAPVVSFEQKYMTPYMAKMPEMMFEQKSQAGRIGLTITNPFLAPLMLTPTGKPIGDVAGTMSYSIGERIIEHPILAPAEAIGTYYTSKVIAEAFGIYGLAAKSGSEAIGTVSPGWGAAAQTFTSKVVPYTFLGMYGIGKGAEITKYGRDFSYEGMTTVVSKQLPTEAIFWAGFGVHGGGSRTVEGYSLLKQDINQFVLEGTKPGMTLGEAPSGLKVSQAATQQRGAFDYVRASTGEAIDIGTKPVRSISNDYKAFAMEGTKPGGAYEPLTRLYRGEEVQAPQKPRTEPLKWYEDVSSMEPAMAKKVTSAREATGRWFTDRLSYAQQYPTDAEGVIKYVDVPKSVAETFRVSNMPEKAGTAWEFSAQGMEDIEFFTSKNVAGKRQPFSVETTPPVKEYSMPVEYLKGKASLPAQYIMAKGEAGMMWAGETAGKAKGFLFESTPSTTPLEPTTLKTPTMYNRNLEAQTYEPDLSGAYGKTTTISEFVSNQLNKPVPLEPQRQPLTEGMGSALGSPSSEITLGEEAYGKAWGPKITDVPRYLYIEAKSFMQDMFAGGRPKFGATPTGTEGGAPKIYKDFSGDLGGEGRIAPKTVGGKSVGGLRPEPSMKSMGTEDVTGREISGKTIGRTTDFRNVEQRPMKPWDLSKAGGKQSALLVSAEHAPSVDRVAVGTAFTGSIFTLGMRPPTLFNPLQSQFITSEETKKKKGFIEVVEPELLIAPETITGTTFAQAYTESQRQHRMETTSGMMSKEVMEAQRREQYGANLLAVSPVTMFALGNTYLAGLSSKQSTDQFSKQGMAQTPAQMTGLIPAQITGQITGQVPVITPMIEPIRTPTPPPPPPPIFPGLPFGFGGGGGGGLFGKRRYAFRERFRVGEGIQFGELGFGKSAKKATKRRRKK